MAQGGTPQARKQAVERVVGPVVSAAGYDLEGVTLVPAGRRTVVRVVVDADGGVQLDDVALLSKAVSAALDADDPFGAAAYTLEVTSPGTDRPLTEPRHWRRARGRLVRASVGGREVEARVGDADDAGVHLTTAGRTEHHAWSALGPGKVQVEFSRPQEKDATNRRDRRTPDTADTPDPDEED